MKRREIDNSIINLEKVADVGDIPFYSRAEKECSFSFNEFEESDKWLEDTKESDYDSLLEMDFFGGKR